MVSAEHYQPRIVNNVNKIAGMATGDRKNPGARFYEKEVLIVLKIHRTSDIHMGTVAP